MLSICASAAIFNPAAQEPYEPTARQDGKDTDT
jgi:hypothetical protein